MLYVLLVTGAVLCAIQAVRAKRLLIAALWLAGVSALVSVILYALGAHAVLPKPLASGLIIVSVILLGWMILPSIGGITPIAEPPFAAVLWQDRGLDVLVQIVLIFAGVLGLLAEVRVPVKRQQRVKTESPQPVRPAPKEVRP